MSNNLITYQEECIESNTRTEVIDGSVDNSRSRLRPALTSAQFHVDDRAARGAKQYRFTYRLRFRQLQEVGNLVQ